MPPKRYFDALPEHPERIVPGRRGNGNSNPELAGAESPQPEGSAPPAAKRIKPNTEPDQSLTTLHVTHLSLTVTTPALAAHFSTCGELKSCFVVCEKNNGPSRGFGYVAYTEVQQAEEALKRLNGSSLEGRTISLGWAKRRQREGESSSSQPQQPQGQQQSSSGKGRNLDREMAERSKAARKAQAQAQISASDGTSASDNARLIICVRGLGQPLVDSTQAQTTEDNDALKKALYKKVKKMAYGLDKSVAEDALLQVQYPVEDGLAHVICPSLRVATLLSAKLHDHIFKARLLTTYLLASHRSLTVRGRSAGGRLVLRNLPFTTTTSDLFALFCPFGQIHSIDLPTDDKGKARGFAFVWFFKKDEAAAAMAKINGVTVHGGLTEWSERIKRGGEGKKQTRLRKKRDQFFGEKEEAAAEGDAAAATATSSSKTPEGRVVAVDWAISKDKFEQAEQQQEQQQKLEDATQKSSAASEDDSDEDSDEEEEDDDDDGPVPLDLSEAQQVDDEEHSEQGQEPTEEHPTLFVRNIQFESTSADLHALFKQFGPVKYAVIVTDPVTGRSRGTGFVSFYTQEAADSVLKLSDHLSTTEPTTSSKPTANPFAAPSLIVADPSSSQATKLTLHGRVLNVTPSVSKKQAEDLRESNDRSKQVKDRRNLYLLHEGHFGEAQLERMGLDKSDAEARVTSYESRKRLLRTNPSLYLSRCRLSIRQVPTYVTDANLRALARHALKAFQEEVKAGTRKDLTKEEAKERDEKEGLGVVSVRKQKVKKDGTVLPPARVQQAKVLRQADKVDTVTGLGKSKGYGFLELASHADALRVLRWINANADVGKFLRDEAVNEMQRWIDKEKDEERKTRLVEKIKAFKEEHHKGKLKRTLILEFSVENIQTVRRREAKASKFAEAANKRAETSRQAKAAEAKQKKAEAQTKRKTDAKEDKLAKEKSLIGRKRKEKKAKKGKAA